MSVWPPTNIVLADGSTPTFSWMFMALIVDGHWVDKLGRAGGRPTTDQGVTCSLGRGGGRILVAAFAGANMRWDSPELYAHWDNGRPHAHTHSMAEYQNPG